MRLKFLPRKKIDSLPQKIGVYCFVGKNNKEILYIGKAVNIRERVKNHFHPHTTTRMFDVGVNQTSYHGKPFTDKTEKIGWTETNSEIEALLLEADLIKKYKPKYNTIWKDDKNYYFVAITGENPPRVLITHQPKQSSTANYHSTIHIGPFVDGKSLKKVLSLLRRVFPYYVARKHPSKECSWCHIDLCPGPNPDIKEYKQGLDKLALVLQGKRFSVLNKLRKEMLQTSKKQEFERAGRIKDQIASLERIMANAKILDRKNATEANWQDTKKIMKKLLKMKKGISRIEAYDISNIQGKMATGSMVVFVEGKSAKNLYRKFRIKMKNAPNDTAMIKEVLNRRFNHPEWDLPQLILIDGGIGQLSVALKVKSQNSNLKTLICVSLAKKKNELFIEGRKQPLLLKNLPRPIFNLILQLRDEAHRFAITYHKKLREVDPVRIPRWQLFPQRTSRRSHLIGF